MLSRSLRRVLAALALTASLPALFGCPAPAGPVTPVTTAPGGPTLGKVCTSEADCAKGEDCQGSDACGSVWHCGPVRQCTMDLVEYCGCDATVFRGSSTCPQKPYQHRGRC